MPDDTDIVIFEITQGCCIALAAAKEVLVDAGRSTKRWRK